MGFGHGVRENQPRPDTDARRAAFSPNPAKMTGEVMYTGFTMTVRFLHILVATVALALLGGLSGSAVAASCCAESRPAEAVAKACASGCGCCCADRAADGAQDAPCAGGGACTCLGATPEGALPEAVASPSPRFERSDAPALLPAAARTAWISSDVVLSHAAPGADHATGPPLYLLHRVILN